MNQLAPGRPFSMEEWPLETPVPNREEKHEHYPQTDHRRFRRRHGRRRRHAVLRRRSHRHHHAEPRQPVLQGGSRRRGGEGQGTRLRDAGPRA
nr:hypothetical protein SHINE37_43401 [Rhizobiaceae bacterium]